VALFPYETATRKILNSESLIRPDSPDTHHT